MEGAWHGTEAARTMKGEGKEPAAGVVSWRTGQGGDRRAKVVGMGSDEDTTRGLEGWSWEEQVEGKTRAFLWEMGGY